VSSVAADPDAFLELRGITKRFPGVVANDGVDLTLRRGEIHGLLGENGAGKSTLMKVLYGLYTADEGEVVLRGEFLRLHSPQDAIEHGIGMVHQHFKLIPRLSVVENVALGEREPAAQFRGRGGLVGRLGRAFSLGLAGPRQRIRDLSAEYGLDVDPDATVLELDVGQQQRVEILKALYRDVDLLILDEPTAVLTPQEAERLFETLEQLTDQGLTVIFISHKLNEVTAITDRVTVLRDGRKIATVETADVTRAELAEMMVGREVLFSLEREPVPVGDEVLAVRGLHADNDRGVEALAGVDLTVHAGEIVGVAGVSGNGQKELAECLVGLRRSTAGSIRVLGDDVTGRPPRHFVDVGISYVPDDRYRFGCAPALSVRDNAAMKDYRQPRFGEHGLIDYGAMVAYAESLVEDFDIRGVTDVEAVHAGDLSGGNLQKLILARELDREPKVLVANKPTRGVDIGAIEYIRERLLEKRTDGTGTVLISEELDEIFELSDRILVLYEGEFVLETTPDATNQDEVGLAMTGVRPEDAADAVEPAAGGGSA